MHGVKRGRSVQTAEAKAARKAKEASRLQTYLNVEANFFEKKEQKVLNEEALEVTSQILTLNPEFYTAWNYRRQVLAALVEKNNIHEEEDRDEEEESKRKVDFFAAARENVEVESNNATRSNDKIERKRRLLSDDLEFTIHALRAHPKVYWIWNHRKWCLEQLPADEVDGERDEGLKWKRELGMANTMLDLDSRNFHGWNYRRYVLSKLAANSQPSTSLPSFPYSLSRSDSIAEPDRHRNLQLAHDELGYTLSKIESNFSNFSAWHQRSILLPLVWKAEGHDAVTIRKKRDEEFELVKQALFTDPEDQSVWIYHDWLVEQDPTQEVLRREIDVIEELLELEPDSKLCMRALSTYKRLLADVVGSSYRTQAESLVNEAIEHLRKLVQIDPDRQGLYSDLLQDIGKTR